jgi:PadR family transcriptional regulator PadR
MPMDGKYMQQFKKGSLEMALLCLIARGETYGYEIITALNAHGAAVWGYAKEGTIYPILYRLQDAGLIRSRIVPAAANGSSRKYYALTDKGRDTLSELIAFWNEYTVCVDTFIRQCLPKEAEK